MQQQTIAILGATRPEGILIATGLAKGRHKLLLWCPEGLSDAQWMAIDLQKHFPGADVEAVSCNVDASWEADVIIAAIPYDELGVVCDRIKEVANRKILIHIGDTANEAATELCREILPYTKLVNVITEWSGKKSMVFVQGDDGNAVCKVVGLLKEAGITAITTPNNVQLERA